MPYTFTPEDFSKFSEDILKAEGDQATLTSLLADMQGTVTEAIAKDIAQSKKVETIEAENTRLKDANMALFLRVGSSLTQPDKDQTIPDQEDLDQVNTKSYMEKYFESLDK